MDESELASYFGVAPEILPYVPELLQDLWELGSDPELVVSWLGEEGVGPEHRVLDLGCGKGAVAIELAEALGCAVDGVDALPGFVEAARAEARRRGLSGLCRFEVGDLREAIEVSRGYAAVLLVSVGTFGSAAEVIGGCRRCTVPGGLIVVDDCFVDEPGRVEFPGYESLLSREETVRELTSHGDELIREHIVPVEEIREQNRRYTAWIEQRAGELATRHPVLATAFEAYVDHERQESAILETAVTCAGWMLRRVADDGES